MKTYCKDIDITDRELVSNAIHDCLKGKYKRPSTIRLLARYNDVPYIVAKKAVYSKITTTKKVFVEKLIDGIIEELTNRYIDLRPIKYQTKFDSTSMKVRVIGIEDIKQQLLDYIAVYSLKPMLKRIGEYQCASIKGRGQSYGIEAIKRWRRNKSLHYAAKCDIRHCFENISRENLMKFLRRHVKNEPLLWLIDELLCTFDKGLTIGSYLSQALCNLYISQLYHFLSEECYHIRNKRNGTKERRSLVSHVLIYMDDILLLSTNSKYLHRAVEMLIEKAKELGLEIKTTWRIWKIDNNFIDMMGVRIYKDHTTIRRRVYRRLRRTYQLARNLIKSKKLLSLKLARKCISYYGLVKATDSNTADQKYKINFSVKVARKKVSNESKF